MTKSTLITLCLIIFSSFLFGQRRLLILDFNNSFTSDWTVNASRIKSDLFATASLATRTNLMPNTISNSQYDRVFMFGDMGVPSATNLNPIVAFMNGGGAVYVQSEGSCCNNQATYVDSLINLTVLGGNSITHSTIKNGIYQYSTGSGLMCTPFSAHGDTLRTFTGVSPANVLFEVNNVCPGNMNIGDVVAVQFAACDLISGKGALVSCGDFNIFPVNSSCTYSGAFGFSNNNLVIELISDVMDSLPSCARISTASPIVTPLQNNTICVGTLVPTSTFISNPTGGTMTWTNSNTAIGLAASGTGNTPAFTATNTTNGTITATISATSTLGGCSGPPSTYTISVNPTPTISGLRNLNFCNGDNVPASNFISNPAGGTITWNNSNTAIGLAASGTGNTPAFTATNTTNGTLTATISVTSTLSGCSGPPTTYSIEIDSDSLNVGIGSHICLGDPLTLTATNSGSGVITWYSDLTGTSVIGTGNPFTPTITNPGTYTYYVNEVGGCATELDSVTIIASEISAQINPTPTSGTLPLNVFFGNGSTTASNITYSWIFGTGDTSNTFTPSYTYHNEGNYIVTLVVTDGFCVDTAQITIEVFKASVLIVPTVFSPNGDGQNDEFKFIEQNIISITAEIYNRWGKQLFLWNEINNGWDGKTRNGKNAPDGTYFYIVKAIDKDKKEYLKKGSFSLMR